MSQRPSRSLFREILTFLRDMTVLRLFGLFLVFLIFGLQVIITFK